MHACDGRTDRIVLAILRLQYMQRGKNVQINLKLYLSIKFLCTFNMNLYAVSVNVCIFANFAQF